VLRTGLCQADSLKTICHEIENFSRPGGFCRRVGDLLPTIDQFHDQDRFHQKNDRGYEWFISWFLQWSGGQ